MKKTIINIKNFLFFENFLSKQIILEIFKFILFAGTAAIISIILGILFYSVYDFNYQLSVSVAYIIGKIINFFVSKYIVFPVGPRNTYQEFITYALVSLGGLFLTLLLTSFFLYLMSKVTFLSSNLQKIMSHIISVGFIGIYTFIGHKFLSFKKGIKVAFKNSLSK